MTVNVTLRQQKGAPLTFAEVDSNFQELASSANASESALLAADVRLDALEADLSVTTNKIADSAVTTAKIANLAVTTAKIADGNVTTAKIADSAISADKLATDSVTNAKIADSAVNTAEIAPLAVTTEKIADSAITSAKIADGAIQTVDLADGSVSLAKLNNAVSSRLGSQGAISGDRNRVINGSCQIVNVATVAVPNNTINVYGGPELFKAANVAAGGQFTQSQQSLSFGGLTLPTVRQTVNTANTNIGTTNYWSGIEQTLEGFNVFDLRGKPVALSFVFNTNLSGTYSVAVRDSNGSQSYVTTITAVANTPRQVTIPLAAIPSAANVPNSNGAGIAVNIGQLNTGTLQTATLNQWQSGNFTTATGATNWGATAGNFIELTNLQLEEGTVATDFIRRSYGVELALTQRYYEQSYQLGVTPGTNTAVNATYFVSANPNAGGTRFNQEFKVKKRALPTTQLYSRIGTLNSIYNESTPGDLAASAQNIGDDRFFVANTATAIVQNVYSYHWTASARL